MKYLKSIFEFITESKKFEKLSKDLEIFKSKLKNKEVLNDDNFDDIIKILERDCGQFIREIKNSNSIVFRGFKKIGSPHTEDEESIIGLYKKERIHGRYPLDLRGDLSEDLDDLFVKKFNFRLRSDGVFTTKLPSTAEGYSESPTDYTRKRKAYIFFPIGDYDYYWNPQIEDLFSMLEGEDWYRYYNEEDFEDLSFLYDKIYGDPKLHPYSQWAGYFELNGVPIKIKYKYPYTKHLIEHIHDNYKDFGLEEPKDRKVKIGNNILSIDQPMGWKSTDTLKNIDELKWIPDMTYDDEYVESKKFNKDEKLNEIVDGYKTGDIESVIEQEITFDCDYYYLIEEDYYFKLLEYLSK
jgi:hypothetical protein